MTAVADISQFRPPTSDYKKNENLSRNEKSRDVRQQNILAAHGIADTIRTSLGPKGMDKMIQYSKGDVMITNDGATILNEMSVTHPAARMLVEMSKAQDIEAGDGTTTVVVIAGALLYAAHQLLSRSIHPQTISEAYIEAAFKGTEILQAMAIPIDLKDTENLTRAAITALSSKVVSQNANLLAPMAVEAVLKITDITNASNVDLRNIRVVKKLGGTIEDTELIDGLVFTNQKVSRVAGGPSKIKNAKIGLIQFCLSPPKTDMENNIIIKNYQAMDRLLKEERIIVGSMVQKIAKTGCNVLLIQKSILRDAVTDLSLDFLAKAGILVVRDIEREDIDFISKTLNCEPVASIDHFTESRLGSANMVIDEVIEAGGRITRITGVPGKSTVTILVRASNNLMLDEVERSLHDVLCVVRSFVKNRALVAGGGAPEMELSQKLYEWSNTKRGAFSLCVRAFAEALEVVPYTLAENAALSPIKVVTELRKRHALGEKNAGINVRKGCVMDMTAEKVIQPLLVSLSALKLATETVTSILRIDDIVMTR